MQRSASLQRFHEAALWDVLVIGGGATGLGAALDAATRDYTTALLEQADFAQATSSRSTKLIHGGVRYLRSGNVRLVREALHERTRLLENAPELVRPLRFVIPTGSVRVTGYYAAGLFLYDLLAGRHRMARSAILSRRRCAELLPTVDPRLLGRAVMYSDAQFDDARLAIALARTFAERGGAPLNHARVTGLLRDGARIAGARFTDAVTGEEEEIRARVVINATGIFSDSIRRMDDSGAESTLTPSRGAHIVLPRRFLPGEAALLIPETADGRVLFAIPWHGRVLLGTTDTPVEKPHLEPRPLAADTEFLIEHARKYLGWNIAQSDILSAFAGLRPLVRQSGANTTALLPRDHVVSVSVAGLVSIVGGKWTTYRRMAEDVVDAAAQVGGLEKRPCVTKTLRLRCTTPPLDEHWRMHPNLPITPAEVRRAVRDEMAVELEDVLSRRTRALILDARAASEIAPQVATLMANELGRNSEWEMRQVIAFRELARGYLV